MTREAVLGYMRERAKRPLAFREMLTRMRIPNSQRRRFKRIVRELSDSGELVRTKRGLYGATAEMPLVTGHFEAHREGYGFVIQAQPGQQDVFVPARNTKGAMDGDRVVVKVEDARRRSGRIARILERARTRLAGVVERSGEIAFVRPRNSAVSLEIYLPPSESKALRDVARVLVEIVEYGTGRRPALGRLVRELKVPQTPREDVESIIEEHLLPKRFPSSVKAAAEAARDRPFGKRKDLRRLPTVTIDGETAKDFDDAVSIKNTEGGGFSLWVHIADVGLYVDWGGPLDLEAQKRGTSVYFPGRVIPMLPKELSEDLCSLRPGEDRPAFTVEMEFSPKGVRKSARFYKSLINSNERMTYTSVRKIVVDGDEAERGKYAGLTGEFDAMSELAKAIRHRRMRRGSLDFDLPEPEILLDICGEPEAVLRSERNFAHMIIEDFMIAANEAVADEMSARQAPCLYRIHEEPDERKVESLIGGLKVPGMKIKPGETSLHKLIEAVKGSLYEEVVTYLVLRTLKQARYSEVNAGHFGLASKRYLHFTSPIRRYPDLICHRVLVEALTGRMKDERKQELALLMPDMAFSSSQRERAAVEAEREVVDALRTWFMKDKVGEEFGASITGVTPTGFRVRLVEYYIEGFVPVSDLTDDYYAYDESSVVLRGRHTKRAFSFGQQLTVRVDRVDIEERRVIFGI